VARVVQRDRAVRLNGARINHHTAGPERRIGVGTRLKTNGPVPLKNIYKDSIREIEWNIILEALRVNR